MVLKNILSLFVLLAFAIISAGSFDGGGMVIIILVFILLFIISLVMHASDKQKKEEKQKMRESRKKEQVQKYNEARQKLFEEYGEPDKTIVIKEDDISQEIDVFESKQQIYIVGKMYKFNDILSCSVNDKTRIENGTISTKTKTNNASMIGRAIVGDVIAGPAGAIIGGSTANKSTQIQQSDSVTVHYRTVIININSISDPVVSIYTSTNEKLANEIVGLMNVIISRNNS